MSSFIPLLILLGGGLAFGGFVLFDKLSWRHYMSPKFSQLPDEDLRNRAFESYHELLEVIDKDKASEISYLFKEWIAREDACFVQYRYYLADKYNGYRWRNFEGFMDRAVLAMDELVSCLEELEEEKGVKALIFRVKAVHKAYFRNYIRQVSH